MVNAHIADYISRLQGELAHGLALRRIESDRVVGQFYHSTLTSAFQPVQRQRGDVIGHEAFLRCYGGVEANAGELSPWHIFTRAASDNDLVRLDRLCRTVHAVNYFVHAPRHNLLFLGVQERLLTAVADDHGRAFKRVLRGLGIPADNVVIEIPAVVNSSGVLLSHVVANYRYHGFRVGLTHNWNVPTLLDAIDHLRPDFVRFRYRSGVDALAAAIRAVHVVGGEAIVSHLETAAQVAEACACSADLLQGFAFAQPQARACVPNQDSDHVPDRSGLSVSRDC